MKGYHVSEISPPCGSILGTLEGWERTRNLNGSYKESHCSVSSGYLYYARFDLNNG